jgi:hypothetical protein
MFVLSFLRYLLCVDKCCNYNAIKEIVARHYGELSIMCRNGRGKWIIKQWILQKSGNIHNAFISENQLLITCH